MKNSLFEFMPTNPQQVVHISILLITNHLSHKPCLDLHIYKSNELKSTFIEILNPKKSNIIIGLSINILQWTLIILTLITYTIFLIK